MKRLWIILGSVFTIATLALGTLSVVSVLAHEEVSSHHEFSTTDVTRLDIDTESAVIRIVGDDVDHVTVDATVSHGLRRTTFDLAVIDGTLHISSGCPAGPVAIWCSVELDIVVPSDLPIDVDSHNSRVDLRELAGTLNISSSNGAVELRAATGDIILRTSNGAIRASGLHSDTVEARTSNGPVELTFASPPSTVSARTSNGPVRIVVPDGDEAYAVQATTSRHSRADVAVRTDPGSDRAITARTSNGPVTVYYPTS